MQSTRRGSFSVHRSEKKPQVPNTARQAASLPGDISRGRRSSMPQPTTRPDSPVPSLQGPCDRSLKSEVPCGSCLNWRDRKSTRLNSSHQKISYAVFCLKKKKNFKITAWTYNATKDKDQKVHKRKNI